MRIKNFLTFFLFIGHQLYTMDRTEIELLKVRYEKHRVEAFEHFSRAGLLFCISELYARCAQKYSSNVAYFSLSMHISLHAYQSCLHYGLKGICSFDQANTILSVIVNKK